MWNPFYNLSVNSQLGLCAVALFIFLAIVTTLLDRAVQGNDGNKRSQGNNGNSTVRPKPQKAKPVPPAPAKPQRWEVPVLPYSRVNIMTLHPQKRRLARGRFYVLNLFVSSGNRLWTLPKMNDIQHKLEVAERWIKGEVARYGVYDLDFANEYLYEGPNGTTPWREQIPVLGWAYEPKYELAESMARHLTGRSIFELALIGMRKYQAAQFALVLFLEYDARSHCSHGNNYLPIVLNYARDETGNYELSSGTIAHELLHSIGGAIDLYPRDGYPQVKSDRAEQLYPNSIMINGHDIRGKMLDEVNAWHIGVGAYKYGFDWF